MKKVVKIFLIICLSIVIIELISMYIIHLKRDNENVFIDTLNSINLYDNYYIASGSSNFKYSHYNSMKTYEYKDLDNSLKKVYKEQAKLVKYDEELNVVFESTFDSSYDSCFNDAIVYDNYIYAVGNYVYDESQINLKTKDGLLAKYDLDGKIIWSKNYQVLGDTKFKKVIAVEDGIIVVGQSIYENMEIGNHPTGGGIIVKYDFDGNILWINNFGGNKSGIFNDIIKLDDGYICVGKDALNYGMIVKFSLNGERIWTKNYENTDQIGMNSVKLKDNKLYIAGSFNSSKEKDSEGKSLYQYDAAIFVYDLDGNLLDIYSIGGNDLDRFNSVITLDKSIIAIGYTMSKDIKINNLNYNDKMSEGMIVEFSYDGKIINKEVYSGQKNETLNDIILSSPSKENLINKTNNYIVVGYTNSKRGIFNGNNKDYFSKLIKYDDRLSIIIEK